MLTVTHNLGAMVLPLKRVNSTVNRIIYRARGRRECLLVISCFNVWQCNAPAAAIGSTTMRSIRCGLLLPLHGDLPVRVSVCLFVTTVTPPKTVEPIEDAVYGGNFGRQTRDHLLSGNPDPPWEGVLLPVIRGHARPQSMFSILFRARALYWERSQRTNSSSQTAVCALWTLPLKSTYSELEFSSVHVM